jgi:hypothetical protein
MTSARAAFEGVAFDALAAVSELLGEIGDNAGCERSTATRERRKQAIVFELESKAETVLAALLLSRACSSSSSVQCSRNSSSCQTCFIGSSRSHSTGEGSDERQITSRFQIWPICTASWSLGLHGPSTVCTRSCFRPESGSRGWVSPSARL